MQNSLPDLHNHLMAQLELLRDESMTDEKLDKEMARTKAIAILAIPIINNAKLMLDVQTKLGANEINQETTPDILTGKKLIPDVITTKALTDER